MNKTVLRDFAIESRKYLIDKIQVKLNLFYINENYNLTQNGEIFDLIDENNKKILSLTLDEYKKRNLLLKRIKEIGINQVIEESAYTWFNRLVAIRYMEIHDYLPLGKNNESLGIRVLSSNDNTPNPEIMKFSNLMNNQLDIGFNQEIFLNCKNDNEKFEYILQLVCNKLKKVFPDVFDGVTDYIDLLIPDNMLSETGFVSKLVKGVQEIDFAEVEILGWLYQFYNNDSFNQIYDGNMSKNKVTSEMLPAATQLFTPDWVVKYMVDNTLGNKLNVSNLKYKLSWEDNDKEDSIEKVKFIDPCCGSGHILVYAFEVFYKKYIELGYNKNDIAELILKNNLYGLDIDDRAGQLSILSVLLKAREYDKKLFQKKIELNVMSIKESYEISDVLYSEFSEKNKKNIAELINEFKNSKDIGSLLITNVNQYDELLNEIEENISIFKNDLIDLIYPLIKQKSILNQKYDVIVTNPPYLSFGRMNSILVDYVNNNYKDSKTDLSSAFIEKIYYQMSKNNGYISLVTTKSWMYLQSFEKIRSRVIKDFQFVNIIDFGTELFEGKIGHLPIISWTSKNIKPQNDLTAIKLSDFCYSNRDKKEEEFFNQNNYYHINQLNFLELNGAPVSYWLSDNMIKAFEEGVNLKQIGDTRQGMATSDNSRFLREWWEVDYNKIGIGFQNSTTAKESNKKWFPYNKGGNYRKWYGNCEYIINWENDGKEVKDYAISLYKTASRTIKSMSEYFKDSISWSKIGIENSSFRYYPKGFLFDVAGCCIFTEDIESKKILLAFLNSNVSNTILNAISPTVNYEAGQIASLPILYDKISDKDKIIEIVDNNIKLCKEDWDSCETSWDFEQNILLKENIFDNNLEKAIDNYNRYVTSKTFELKNNEEKLNEYFINLYNLNDELVSTVDDKLISISPKNKLALIKDLISYAVGCMFGRYSLDKNGIQITSNSIFEKNNMIDADNIIPISESSDIYFCDDITARFKKIIELIFGKESLDENLNFIADILGKKGTDTSEDTLRKYFINDFYNDHCKMYQKRPIYWMIDSGKKNGFKALIYIHRYDKQLLSKVRVDYLHKTQDTYERIKNDLLFKINDGIDVKNNQTELGIINYKIEECNKFDEKLGHLANQMIDIDLDDGVKVNYEKFVDILAKIK